MSIENSLSEEEVSREDTTTTIEVQIDYLVNKFEQINGRSIALERAVKDSSIEDAEETGCLMDVLHLQMLQLIEDRITQQLALETQTSRAQLDLARARLQQGTHHVAASARLPSSSRPYKALCRLLEQGMTWGSSLKLLRFNVEPARGYLRPLTHIFGAMVPCSLRHASHKWERCMEQIVECVNVQRELQSVLSFIERLKWAQHRRANV
ncbi:uncharacterized protein LOC6557927 [Drosophila grimshawi]|uniref:Vacuolar ATPase assembly protein VMA22 n=1 Tax=Drosophila grimshawi TaxID=7222 RepID=B4K2D5_DROGR|nr:uncharacterized protein LOC6557927 [Drosophila grimshawi]EDW04926.1 GH25226 [Drosophila grimshawi]